MPARGGATVADARGAGAGAAEEGDMQEDDMDAIMVRRYERCTMHKHKGGRKCGRSRHQVGHQGGHDDVDRSDDSDGDMTPRCAMRPVGASRRWHFRARVKFPPGGTYQLSVNPLEPGGHQCPPASAHVVRCDWAAAAAAPFVHISDRDPGGSVSSRCSHHHPSP
jgi:hypothetical protein